MMNPPRRSTAERLDDPWRLGALRETRLMDSPAEPAYDRLTSLAARIIGAPVSLVSLVDADRQFFKSAYGFHVEPWASRRGTPLSHSFCQHVVATGEALIVEDARDVPLVRDNAAITELGVYAYAGMPLRTPDGSVIGSFCVIDEKPRTWTEDEVSVLRDLAAAATTEIELRLDIRRREAAEAQRDRAYRARADFLASMSHEIRTPLHGVIGMVELLRLSNLDDERRALVDSLDVASRTLLEIVNDVLDFSKLEAGKVVLEMAPFGVDEVVEEAVGIIRPMSDAKHLDVRVVYGHGLPATFIGDAARLKQVLINLLSNAVKYTPSGYVAIEVQALTESGEIGFAVSDTGIGIPAEKLDDIFEPFVQAEMSTARRFGGTGLGLAIGNRMAQLMGGTIGAQSVLGVGSTFTLRLPLVPSQDRHQPGGTRETPMTGAPVGAPVGRVLVVDDNETNRQIASRMLGKLGIEADVAEDGRSGIEAANRVAYALVLLDIQLPDMDGLAVARLLREQLGGKCPPIVATTASVSPRERESYTAAGLSILAKPFTLAELKEAVEAHRRDTAGETESLPIFDEVRLAAVLSLDEPGSPSLLELFQKETGDRLQAIGAAVDSNDSDAVRRGAHSIKGLAGSIGATRLAASAATLESAPDGELPPFSVLTEQLRQEYRLFVDAVREIGRVEL